MMNLQKAVQLVRAIHPHTEAHGCFVALTGGCLYKDGDRKDCDLLFYRIRQCKVIDRDALFNTMTHILGCGFTVYKPGSWVCKARWNDEELDLFFPEEPKIGIIDIFSPTSNVVSNNY